MKFGLYLVTGVQTNYACLLKGAIDIGIRKKIRTYILDLNSLNPKWGSSPNDWDGLGISDSVINIQNLYQLANLQIHQRSVIIFLYPPTGKFLKPWRLLKAKCKNIGFMSLSPVPALNTLNGLSGFRRTLQLLKSRMRFLKSWKKPLPKMWIVSGSETVATYATVFKKPDSIRQVYAHSIEYELLKQEYCCPVQGVPQPSQPYILVLDQGWYSKPRPEFLAAKDYPPASRDKLSLEMDAFLESLVSQVGLEVLVSCHPKADIVDTQKFYPNFIVTNKPTAGLIRQSSLVVANSSTSINYAIIENKPLILFTNSELSNSIVHSIEMGISNELGLDYIDIGAPYDVRLKNMLSTFDNTRYEHYLHRYIRQPCADEKPLWDIIYDSLLGDNYLQ